MKPHKTRGWLNPKCTAEELVQGSRKICEAYLKAPVKWAKEGIKTICTDEKTGMQDTRDEVDFQQHVECTV